MAEQSESKDQKNKSGKYGGGIVINPQISHYSLRPSETDWHINIRELDASVAHTPCSQSSMGTADNELATTTDCTVVKKPTTATPSTTATDLWQQQQADFWTLQHIFCESFSHAFKQQTGFHGPLRFIYETNANDTKDLVNAYLDGFQTDTERRIHNCFHCLKFLRRYGHLACLGKDGKWESILWHDAKLAAPVCYHRCITNMNVVLSRSQVKGIVNCEQAALQCKPNSTRAKKQSLHFHLSFSLHVKRAELKLLTANGNDVKRVREILRKYPKKCYYEQVIAFVKAGLIKDGSQIAAMTWYANLVEQVFPQQEDSDIDDDDDDIDDDDNLNNNIIWNQLQTYGESKFNLPQPVLELLSNIKETTLTLVATRKFNRAMKTQEGALPYLRGSLKQEQPNARVIHALRLTACLEQRHVYLDEIEKNGDLTIWLPHDDGANDNHASIEIKTTTDEIEKCLEYHRFLTFTQFLEQVLPRADSIKYLVQHRENFGGIITNKYIGPPIWKWDVEDDEEHTTTHSQSNYYSWYNTLPKGAKPERFLLRENTMYKVSAVCKLPSLPSSPLASRRQKQQEEYIFIVRGARETRKDCNMFSNGHMLTTDLQTILSHIRVWHNDTKRLCADFSSNETACGIVVAPRAILQSLIFDVHLKHGEGAFICIVDREA